MPRRPAQRPWIALGVSWSRHPAGRRKKRPSDALVLERQARIERAVAFIDQLQCDLVPDAKAQEESLATLADIQATNKTA